MDHKGWDNMMALTGRPYNSVKVLPWKIVTNFEKKGSKLAVYLKERKLTNWREGLKWTRNERTALRHWKENPAESPFRRLNLHELGILFGRTEAAVRKAYQEAFPRMNRQFPEE